MINVDDFKSSKNSFFNPYVNKKKILISFHQIPSNFKNRLTKRLHVWLSLIHFISVVTYRILTLTPIFSSITVLIKMNISLRPELYKAFDWTVLYNLDRSYIFSQIYGISISENPLWLYSKLTITYSHNTYWWLLKRLFKCLQDVISIHKCHIMMN